MVYKCNNLILYYFSNKLIKQTNSKEKKETSNNRKKIEILKHCQLISTEESSLVHIQFIVNHLSQKKELIIISKKNLFDILNNTRLSNNKK